MSYRKAPEPISSKYSYKTTEKVAELYGPYFNVCITLCVLGERERLMMGTACVYLFNFSEMKVTMRFKALKYFSMPSGQHCLILGTDRIFIFIFKN